MNTYQEFICPITFEIFEDPVICTDGYTYERNAILRLPNSISPITRQPIDKNNLIPNRNLKDAIDRYKISTNLKDKKSSNISKLEKFELEEKNKKKLLKDKIKKKLLEKQKREYEEKLKKQYEKEQDNKLLRILQMFNSQNTMTFNYGYYNTYCNNFSNGYTCSIDFRYEYNGMDPKKYIFTIEMLKSIKNENQELLLNKYNKITDDYIWIQKYVIGQELNPLINYVFEELIPKVNNLPEHIKNSEFITRIQKINLKSKEYYIVNYDDFCNDFKIFQKKKSWQESCNSKNIRNQNIFTYWFTTKQNKIYDLINDIFDICGKQDYNINYYNYKYCNNMAMGMNNPSNASQHLLDMYKIYLESKTNRLHITDTNMGYGDIINYYNIDDIKPLMELTKNIIELIDFIQELE